MLAVPPELVQRYEARLVQQNLMAGQRPHYHQWLRYYLDFCQKYGFAQRIARVCPLFRKNCGPSISRKRSASRRVMPYRCIGRWFPPPPPSRALRRAPLPRRALPRLEMFLAPWRNASQAHSRRRNPRSVLPRLPPSLPRFPPRAIISLRRLPVRPPLRNRCPDRKGR